MKKNRNPSLKLSRETLRRLDAFPLRAVGGEEDRPTATQALPCRTVSTVAASCSGFASICNDPSQPEKTCIC